MRILLLGKEGQLGWELCRTMATLGDVIAFDYPEIDFTRPDQLRELVEHIQPQVVVNAAAYTAVDRAETEPEKTDLVNITAPAILAESSRKVSAAFIHFSTDYVFDGEKGSPYTEDDLPAPINQYGKSKLGGERAIQDVGRAFWIFRTSCVYSTRRSSFVSKILQWSRTKRTLQVVSDQVGSPTWARMLAEITAQTLAHGGQDVFGWVKSTQGLYHLGGDGSASRLEWAHAIIELDPKKDEQILETIEPALLVDFPTPARRPLFTALDCNRFYAKFGLRLPNWRQALELGMNPS